MTQLQTKPKKSILKSWRLDMIKFLKKVVEYFKLKEDKELVKWMHDNGIGE